jgi:hypothetical protein
MTTGRLAALISFAVNMTISLSSWRLIAGTDYKSANEIEWWFLVVGLTIGATLVAGAVLAARPRSWQLGGGLLAGSLLALLANGAWLFADMITSGS